MRAQVAEQVLDFQEEAVARDFRTVFQPILECSDPSRLFALKCLSRGPVGSRFGTADELFAWIRSTQNEEVADWLCLEAALRTARHFPGLPLLNQSIHARTVAGSGFPRELVAVTRRLGIAPSRLTLQLVEYDGAQDLSVVLRHLEEVRSLGVRLAVEDVGLGHPNAHRVLEGRPDFIKVGRHLLAEPSGFRRTAEIDSFAQLARRFGARTILEGVETEEQLDLARNLGIDFVQGFLFSRPVSAEMILESGILYPKPQARTL